MPLKSNRLRFSKLQKEDAEHYLSLMMSQEVMQFITGKALDRTSSIQRFNKVLKKNIKNEPYGTYGVYPTMDNRFIGIAKFVLMEKGVVEIGYAILPSFWGKGYGSEISRALVDFGKSIEELQTLEATVDPQNEVSKRILEKCGFKFYGAKTVYDFPGEVFKLKV